MEVELFLEFRLAAEHDLDQLVLRCLQVGKHSQVLQCSDRHVLDLIDNENYIAPRLVFLDEDPVELVDHLRDIVGLGSVPHILINRFKECLEGNVGVEHIDGLHLLLVDLFQKRADDGGFSHPDLADDRDETLALFYAVDHRRQRFLMAGAQIKELRVGGDVERLFFQVEIIQVHET